METRTTGMFKSLAATERHNSKYELLTKNIIMKKKLSRFDNNKLIDIAKNYKRYNYEIEIKEIAIDILGERGICENEIKLLSSEKDNNINQLETILKDYKRSGFITLLFYFIAIVIEVLFSDNGLILLTILYILSILTYLIYYVKTYIKYYDFFKKVDGEAFGPFQQIGFFILGLPFCIFTFPYSLKVMKDKIKNRY